MPGGIVLILAEPNKKRRTAQESGRTNMSIAKIETASGVTLVLNGKTVFASDDTVGENAAKEYKKNGEGKPPRWRHYWCGNGRERRECKFIY